MKPIITVLLGISLFVLAPIAPVSGSPIMKVEQTEGIPQSHLDLVLEAASVEWSMTVEEANYNYNAGLLTIEVAGEDAYTVAYGGDFITVLLDETL